LVIKFCHLTPGGTPTLLNFPALAGAEEGVGIFFEAQVLAPA